MSELLSKLRKRPRICVCVLMNHPFVRNIPLLRRIYGDRFTALRFLVPFERLSDPDVITVYRGSYAHAAYLADARVELEALDCDHYLIVQDDVLLNPRISEESFLDIFDLEPDDGFIPILAPAPETMGQWIWHYGLVAKLLYPKSILFGTGIEPANVAKYLPPAEMLRAAMQRCSVQPAEVIRFDPEQVFGIDTGTLPSRLLLHGLAAQLAEDETQHRIDEASLGIARDLIAAIRADQRTGQGAAEAESGGDAVSLPFPLVAAGATTDFYILPHSGLADFCHYIGVAGAANLFVEVMAPTLLFACCRRVRTAADLGLDVSGFDVPYQPDWLLNAAAMAIHPFKLSVIDTAPAQDALVEMLTAIGDGRMPSVEAMIEAGFEASLGGILREGPQEPWGTWAMRADATLELPVTAPTTVLLHLHAPLHPHVPILTGTLSFNEGTSSVLFEAAWPHADIIVCAEDVGPGPDGISRLTLTCDRLVVPAELSDDSLDTRSLGFGLTCVEWSGFRVAATTSAPKTGR